MTRRQKYLAKEMRAYILVSHVIDGETQLYDLGGISVSYILYIPFERLDCGYKTECRPGMRFVTWCIFKLDCYVNLFSACRILIVANSISHLGIKMISWIWVFGDVTKTLAFYDHIQVNCLFLPVKNIFPLKKPGLVKVHSLQLETKCINLLFLILYVLGACQLLLPVLVAL